MQIITEKDSITVHSKHFDTTATLQCGQVFRFTPQANGFYRVYSGDKQCLIKTEGDKTTIITEDVGYFVNYFDLNYDYSSLIDRLNKFPELEAGIAKANAGIHILRQDIFETIISFIISQNNNIPRIKAIIERLCSGYGTYKNGFYAFPTPQQLSGVSIEDYKSMGLGYRDSYIFNAIKVINGTNFVDKLLKMSYNESVKYLCTLKGVGRKVADCISFFGLRHTCCYPTDTWIFKADAVEGDTKDTVRLKGMERYGNDAGFAQQYRFYFGINGE